MNAKQKKWVRFRIIVVALFFVAGLCCVLARAYQLQIMEREKLVAIARDNYQRVVNLPPRRGTIYDRNRKELAVSVEVKSVYAHPGKVAGKDKNAARLARVLGKERREISGLLKSDRPFVWLERQVSPGTARDVKRMGIRGVGLMTETERYYPGKRIAANVVGLSGVDQQGLEGLELSYDRLLKGPPQRIIQMQDARLRAFSMANAGAASPEDEVHDIVLTIDKDIQYKAEQILAEAVSRTGAKAGHCLVMDPGTGEILAMAVVPGFNPNAFSRYGPSQWRNRAITDCYEPGSTMKAFLLAAALEEKVVSPATTFDCEQGDFSIDGHVIHDAHKQGVLSVSQIVVRSSNIGAVKIGMTLGYEKFSEYLKRFGFGSKTGVTLPGERDGFVRPASKARVIDRANLFFGQGMSVTSLQMAMAMSVIANGGVLMRPFIVKSVYNASGNEVERNTPTVVRRVISEETSKKVAEILEKVVQEGGTGRRAAIRGFRAAGKTGTAQKVEPGGEGYSESRYVAGFMGFVPVEHPRMVIAVMIDEPSGVPYGGVAAAPVFREVAEWALNKLGADPRGRLVEKASGGGLSVIRPGAGRVKFRSRVVRSDTLPDFRGLSMRDVLRKGRALGLEVELEGTGLAVRQKPRAGSPLKKVKKVRVSFLPPA